MNLKKSETLDISYAAYLLRPLFSSQLKLNGYSNVDLKEIFSINRLKSIIPLLSFSINTEKESDIISSLLGVSIANKTVYAEIENTKYSICINGNDHLKNIPRGYFVICGQNFKTVMDVRELFSIVKIFKSLINDSEYIGALRSGNIEFSKPNALDLPKGTRIFLQNEVEKTMRAIIGLSEHDDIRQSLYKLKLIYGDF